jgi:hypothetical protein
MPGRRATFSHLPTCSQSRNRLCPPPVTLEDIIAGAPAYQTGSQKKETLRRMFERDKDELRTFGILICTVEDRDGDPDDYQLLPSEFS